MDGNGELAADSPPQQSPRPIHPRSLDPASIPPLNHALPHTSSPQQSPHDRSAFPTNTNQSPPPGYHIAYGIPSGPPHVSRNYPPGSYPPAFQQNSPTAYNHGQYELQQRYSQATPGGPYRLLPSLASDASLQHIAPRPGSFPPPSNFPQSTHASPQSQGNWWDNISQTSYPNAPGQGSNQSWQQQYAQAFSYPQNPQSSLRQGEGHQRQSLGTNNASPLPGNPPVKKTRKPRVTKKKSDQQVGVAEPANGQDISDPKNPQQNSTPVKKARKPRAPNKPRTQPQIASKPIIRDIRPNVSEASYPQLLPRPVQIEAASPMRISENGKELVELLPRAVQTETSSPMKISENREGLGKRYLESSSHEVSGGISTLVSSTTEFHAVSAARRSEIRDGLVERDHENMSRKVSRPGPNVPLKTLESAPTPDPNVPLKTIESAPAPVAIQPQSRQWQRPASPEDDNSDSDSESGEDNEYGKIMSQVSKYKGGLVQAMGGRPQDNRSGFSLLNGLADIEQEEEEEEDEEDEEDDEEDVDSTPDPNRLRKVNHRGPHPAAEVTGEIKLRLGLANEAFAESKIDKAKALVDEIIRINAETYEAWNLLSSIFQEQGLVEDALMALIVAAHLRPKHIDSWFNAAEYALTSMGPLTPKLLGDAQFCFSSAIRQVPTSLVARRRKIEVILLRQNYNLAARELQYLLRTIPHDLEVIRELAMVYVDLGDGNAGVELYKKAIKHYRKVPDDFDFSIDWNDLHSCAVLYSLTSKVEEGLKEMKAYARWLLGREEEAFWDDITENDCEWDVDDSRRVVSVEQYKPGSHPISAYGLGLPIELRVYFGKYRLRLKQYKEAMRHFMFLLEKDAETELDMVESHSHLVIDIAKSLYAEDQHKDCLKFYGALKNQLPDEMTAEGYLHMGKCFLYDDRAKEAEAAFKESCEIDKSSIEARIQLARLYERMDESERAFVYVNQVIELESVKQPKMYHRQRRQPLLEPQQGKSFLPAPPKALRKKKAIELRDIQRATVARELRDRYQVLRKETDEMKAGKNRATDAWMDSARALTEDFRSCKAFYPWDRKEFDGYSKEETAKALTSLRHDLKALNLEHAEDLGIGVLIDSNSANYYRGINFKDWIDIFCEYALCLAKRGRSREAYDIIEAGIHAICFMFNKEDMFMLHICYCVCALMGNDEETCVGMARWFMVRYQFCTDSYRMFAALLRMCHSPISWYSSGPTQKFILRQIKTMDWALSNEERRGVIKGDKSNYTQMDESGNPIVNTELDVSLLMAYGHILVAGSSYVYALNYFHRALSVDPDNPMIVLSLGLSYIQYGLKRQVDNRQYVITQGLTFMHRYYDLRLPSAHFEERQEAHYNMARTYHLLGLTNLAIPFYRKVLKGGDDEENVKGENEDWCLDAAYNLQTIYTTAGNMELAGSLTRKWLVI